MTIQERNTKKRLNRARYIELKEMLEARRLEIIGEVQHKMRDARLEHAASVTPNVRDEAESSEADIQGDIEFAVLQMKTENAPQNHGGDRPPGRGYLRVLLRVRCGDLDRAVCARCRSPCAARSARRNARWRSSGKQMYAARRSPASLFADFQG